MNVKRMRRNVARTYNDKEIKTYSYKELLEARSFEDLVMRWYISFEKRMRAKHGDRFTSITSTRHEQVNENLKVLLEVDLCKFL